MRPSRRFDERSFAFARPEVLAFFRARHPLKAAAAVAAAAGTTERAAQKWLSGEAEPTWRKTWRLVDAYGAELAALLLPGCAWASDAAMAAQRARLDAQIEDLEARRAALIDTRGFAPGPRS